LEIAQGIKEPEKPSVTALARAWARSVRSRRPRDGRLQLASGNHQEDATRDWHAAKALQNAWVGAKSSSLCRIGIVFPRPRL